MEFEGEFETHVTVRPEGPADLDRLRDWAARHRVKFHHIVLDRGRTPSQPMVTLRGRGGLSGVRDGAIDLARRLAEDGFDVSRVKVEAAPENRDVPDSDAEAASFHDGRYFEHHVKLALGPEADLIALTELAVPHGAHLSRNARRVRDDGLQERFITQRCHRVGRATAQARLDGLVNALAAFGAPILSVEQEFVVLDDAPNVDDGWLAAGGSS